MAFFFVEKKIKKYFMTTLNIVISFAMKFMYFLINPFRVYVSTMAMFYRRRYDLINIYKIEPADKFVWKFQSPAYKLHKKDIIDLKNVLIFMLLAFNLSELITMIVLAILILFRWFDGDIRIVCIFSFIFVNFVLLGIELLFCYARVAWHCRMYPRIYLLTSCWFLIYEWYTGLVINSLWFVWLYFKNLEQVVMSIDNIS